MRFYFRGHRVRSVSRYTGRKVAVRRLRTLRPDFVARLKQADRFSLLVTTALASTLIIGTLFTPLPQPPSIARSLPADRSP